MAVAIKPSSTIPHKRPADSPYQLDPDHTLKASRALLQHVQAETKRLQAASSKKNLLAVDASDSDDESGADSTASIWLTLTTKQHIVDKTRLKPNKIAVPHSLNTSDDLRICLITADPQRAVKNVVADLSFPENLKSRITRIIGITKLKSRYKTFETRRQLLAEHDVFLADERIITRLPAVLGKIFYKSASKRPIPFTVAKSERTQQGAQSTPKAKKETASSPKSPESLAKEIDKAVDCVPVSLRPGTLLSVRVGLASFTPEQLAENVSAVVQAVVEKHVVKGWRNVKGIHIKGHSTFAVPIWLADDLWTDASDINAKEVEQGLNGESQDETAKAQKRKRNPTTTKGPQAGTRKKTKVEEAEEGKAEQDRKLKAERKSKLAKQKAEVFSDSV